MWTRAELELGFQHYQDTVYQAGTTRNWNLFADLFTEGAVYNEHAYGRFNGREEIRAWAVKTMSTFPGNCMPVFPIAWYVLDEERGWIVCEIRNVMADPGDGSVYETSNFTVLHYAGDNLFSYEEDVYNPAHFLALVTRWGRRSSELGHLSDDGRSWLEHVAPGWDAPAA